MFGGSFFARNDRLWSKKIALDVSVNYPTQYHLTFFLIYDCIERLIEHWLLLSKEPLDLHYTYIT